VWVRDQDSLDVGDDETVVGQPVRQRRVSLIGRGAGIDQREGVGREEIAVHLADTERCRDPNPVDLIHAWVHAVR